MTLTPAEELEELPGLCGASPWRCSIPPPPQHPPPNAAVAVRTRTAALPLLPLAAPTTVGEARGSVRGTGSEAMDHERRQRRIVGGWGRTGRSRYGFTGPTARRAAGSSLID